MHKTQNNYQIFTHPEIDLIQKKNPQTQYNFICRSNKKRIHYLENRGCWEKRTPAALPKPKVAAEEETGAAGGAPKAKVEPAAPLAGAGRVSPLGRGAGPTQRPSLSSPLPTWATT